MPIPLRHTPQGSLPYLWRTLSPGPDIRTLILVPFLLCWSSRGSASLAIPAAIQWWWTGHLHVGSSRSPGTSRYKTLGRGLPKPWWTVRGSEACSNSAMIRDVPATFSPCHISSAWWPWSPGIWGGLDLPQVYFCEGVWCSSRNLHLRGTHSALSRQLACRCHPAQLSSVIADRVPASNI